MPLRHAPVTQRAQTYKSNNQTITISNSNTTFQFPLFSTSVTPCAIFRAKRARKTRHAVIFGDRSALGAVDNSVDKKSD
jgi:hypothetical protein